MKQRVHKGLLFIPDISGFTELVHSTDVLTGQQITYELLSAVLRENKLQLQISEVEGDAILFYRFGPAPKLDFLLCQYEKMKLAFDEQLKQIENRLSRPLPLSLKVIAHYGEMTEFSIGGFRKLYGEAVVEAHRLLKNSVPSNTYLLVTDSLKEQAAGFQASRFVQEGVQANEICEVYDGLRLICFSYFDSTNIAVAEKAACEHTAVATHTTRFLQQRTSETTLEQLKRVQ